MKTRVYTYQDLEKQQVQEDIRQTFTEGKNVVFPTETVYGIGGYALSKEGISGIYSVKGRPSDNPLILHVAKQEDIKPFIKTVQPYARKLMEHFWPGPLTLVMEKSDIVPMYITGGLHTVGIRVPGSEIARKVIEIAGLPICAPSANISGRPSSTLVEHVIEDFMDKVDIIIDGGKSEIGLESTVVDVTGEFPEILRPGMVTSEMIKEVVGAVQFSQAIDENDTPKSPGMKYKHYAPKGMLTIIEGSPTQVIDYMNQKIIESKETGVKVGVLIPIEYVGLVEPDEIFMMGSLHNSKEIASNLFEGLRSMDSKNVDVIYTFAFHQGEMKDAIMNRLLKAANYQVISLK